MSDLTWLTSLGYVGAFLASFLGCATFVIPIPYTIVLIALATTLDPILLSIFGGVGAALGEFTAYAIGWGVTYGNKKLVERKEDGKRNKVLNWWYINTKTLSKWFYKNGFLTILLFAATPLPDDFVGFIAGTANYNKKRFLLAALLGKVIMCLVVVYTAKYGIEVVTNWWVI